MLKIYDGTKTCVFANTKNKKTHTLFPRDVSYSSAGTVQCVLQDFKLKSRLNGEVHVGVRSQTGGVHHARSFVVNDEHREPHRSHIHREREAIRRDLNPLYREKKILLLEMTSGQFSWNLIHVNGLNCARWFGPNNPPHARGAEGWLQKRKTELWCLLHLLCYGRSKCNEGNRLLSSRL